MLVLKTFQSTDCVKESIGINVLIIVGYSSFCKIFPKTKTKQRPVGLEFDLQDINLFLSMFPSEELRVEKS